MHKNSSFRLKIVGKSTRKRKKNSPNNRFNLRFFPVAQKQVQNSFNASFEICFSDVLHFSSATASNKRTQHIRLIADRIKTNNTRQPFAIDRIFAYISQFVRLPEERNTFPVGFPEWLIEFNKNLVNRAKAHALNTIDFYLWQHRFKQCQMMLLQNAQRNRTNQMIVQIFTAIGTFDLNAISAKIRWIVRDFGNFFVQQYFWFDVNCIRRTFGDFVLQIETTNDAMLNAHNRKTAKDYVRCLPAANQRPCDSLCLSNWASCCPDIPSTPNSGHMTHHTINRTLSTMFAFDETSRMLRAANLYQYHCIRRCEMPDKT